MTFEPAYVLLPEDYDHLTFFVFTTAPFLLTVPSWLAVLAICVVWLIHRRTR